MRRCIVAYRVALVAALLTAFLTTGAARAQGEEGTTPDSRKPEQAEPFDPAPGAPTEQNVVSPLARDLFAEGLEHFKTRRFKEAVEKFRASYELSHVPGLLYNMAQAQRLNGDCADAVATYRLFLATNPQGKLRERTEARIRDLEPCANTKLSASGDGSVQVRSSPSDVQAPRSRTSPVTQSAGRAEHVSSRQSRPLVVAAQRKPATKAVTSRPGALIGFGSAAALLAIGGYFGWRSSEAANDVSRIFESGGTWDANAAELEARGKRDEKFAIATVAGGLIAAGVGTWFLTFD
jgi:hypothetical protein